MEQYEDEFEDDQGDFSDDDPDQIDQIDNRLYLYSDNYNTTVIYEYYDEEDNLFLVKDKKYVGLISKRNIQSMVDFSRTEEYFNETEKQIQNNENTLILHAIHSYCEYRKDSAIVYVQYKVSAKNE